MSDPKASSRPSNAIGSTLIRVPIPIYVAFNVLSPSLAKSKLNDVITNSWFLLLYFQKPESFSCNLPFIKLTTIFNSTCLQFILISRPIILS